ELSVAAHKDRAEPAHTTRTHERQGADELTRNDALRLSLRVDGNRRRELERATNCSCCPLAHEDLARPGCLLETRAHVHCVSRDERRPLPRPTHDDFSRVDADPQRER